MSTSDRGIITIFPTGMDTSDLIEITTMSSRGFAKFISKYSDRTYDCEVFYNQMLEDEIRERV